MTIRVCLPLLLAGAWFGFIVSSGAAQPATDDATFDTPPTLVTNAAQIAALGTNIPPALYRAEIEGIIIYVSPSLRRFYVQQGERGVQVNMVGSVVRYRLGERVAVTGTVLGGWPELRLANCEARVLSEGSLPEPKSVSPYRLAAGSDAFCYLSVHGVIRDIVANKNHLHMQVAYEGLVFEAVVQGDNLPLPRPWLDAEVELRGLSWPVRDSNGRASGFRFHSPDTNFVTVLNPGVPDPFARPLLSCADAARLPQQWIGRVRISGTVTAYRPDEGFYLDDGTGVMHVQLLQPLAPLAGSEHLEHEPQTWLKPGERVEVIGLRRNWYSLAPSLIQAEYRRVGQGTPPQPRRVSVRELLEGRFPGELVTLEARVLDQRFWTSLRMSTLSLVLRTGDDVFQARWESETGAKWDLKLDGYVRITGVNDAEGSLSRRRSTFQLLLRSPGDVVPAPEPVFWTRPEVRRIALGAGGVGVVAAAFIFLQRLQVRRLERRVLERTTDLSSTNVLLKSEVMARERAEEELRLALNAEKELNQLKSSFVSMVSHEFRTPLEVILSSSHILDRYLERLTPEKRHEQLRAIRKSVHRMSDLMEDVLMLGKMEAARMTCSPAPVDLAAFCRRCVDEIECATQSVCPIHLTTDGVSRDATADEGLLGHIVLNLLSNAVKYSPPGNAVAFLAFRDGLNARFLVRDAGHGIPAADLPRLFTAFYRAPNVSQIPGSGLGLVIVKRCVELHGGEIHCESTEGKGTTFTVTLPLFDGTRIFRRTAPDPALS